jgi:hypothetical protein
MFVGILAISHVWFNGESATVEAPVVDQDEIAADPAR